MNISREQIRAARALLDWSQNDLANEAGLSKTAIANVENGKHRPTTKNAKSIVNAFKRYDIEMIDGGVRRKKNMVTIYDGSDALVKFSDNVYLEVKKTGGDVLISGVDEEMFIKNTPTEDHDRHIKRMLDLDNYHCKCLIKEADTNPHKVDYAEYREVPAELYSNVPFYVYGTKMAMILWKDTPKVIVIDDIDLTEAYRKQFNYLWTRL